MKVRNLIYTTIIAGLGLVAMSIAVSAPAPFSAQPASVKVSINDKGHGSGVHIGDGVILTAGHVVDEPEAKYVIEAADGRKTPAEVLWSNKAYDIGLLHARGAALRAASVSCRSPAVGEEVSAVGNPLDYEHVTVSGRVAKEAAEFKQDIGPSWRSAFTVDITGGPGLSGAPVFDRLGYVIGIVVGGVGVRFPIRSFMLAVPMDAACKLMGRV